MVEQSDPGYCGQCGNRLQPGDGFCGECGAAVLPSAPQAEQVIPREVAAAQGAAYASRRRKRLWVNAAAISLILLVSVGAVAALALNDGLGLLGGTGQRQADNPPNVPAPGDRGNGTTEPTMPPSSTQPNPDEEAIIKAIQGYHEALEDNDFEEAYSYLGPTARISEDQDTFADRYKNYEIQSNQIYYLDVEKVSEDTATARVEIGYEYKDGRRSRFDNTWQLVREGEDWKLDEASSEQLEVRYPETTTPESTGTGDLAAQAEEAAGDYYWAADLEDWAFTYEHLDSETRSRFTREEWFEKNQWLADQGEATYYIESVELDETSQDPLAEVSVRITSEDGSSFVRDTFWVLENGEWLHRFGQEEYDSLMPGVPFEEWVEDEGGATPDGTEQYQNVPSPDELFPEDTNGDEGEGI